jgi:hypothetical protein
LWPDPLIQLNPTFKPGKTVDELVTAGVLNPGLLRSSVAKKLRQSAAAKTSAGR